MKLYFRIISVIAAVLVALMLANPIHPVTAQGNPANTITVSGVGSTTSSPDVAFVELGVENVNTTLATAFSKTNDTIGAINQALNKLGIAASDIQTSKLVISPQDRPDPRGGPTGSFIYRVHSSLRITVHDLSRLQGVISSSVEAGANFIDSLTYGVSDIPSVEETARTAAIKNARTRADELAAGLGLTVGDPMTITETVTNSGLQPISLSTGAASDSTPIASAAADIGQLVVTVQIQVTYTIRLGHS